MTSLDVSKQLTPQEAIEIQTSVLRLNLDITKTSNIEQQFFELYSELFRLHRMITDAAKEKNKQ